ncbi:atrial natriuretic peptide receptor 3-like [Patiria miniata]|uniref:Receptor ligand binding region domain-containing protein n=1 Tax=Patiria miniata TaxID=46514 RepID=A0A913Z4Q8_PATMI|nr:atrial natriuretic peptide receptor 3-like [Patiria miniata]
MEGKCKCSVMLGFLVCLVSILGYIQQAECKIEGFKNSTKLQASDGRQVINIAVLLPFSDQFDYSIRKTVPAILTAIESPRVQELVGSSLDLSNVTVYNTRCSAVEALKYAVDALRSQQAVDIYFGPACSYAAANIARMITHWGKVMVSSGCEDGGLDYYPITRVYLTATHLGAAIADVVLNTFQWNTTVVLADDRQQREDLTLCYALSLGYIENMPPEYEPQSQLVRRDASMEDIKQILKEWVMPYGRSKGGSSS